MMRTVLALVKKEFSQIRRDRTMLRVMFVMPIVQMVVLGYVVSTDVKSIRTAVHDYDRSEASRKYVRALTAGGYFVAFAGEGSPTEADLGFRYNKYDAVLIIPEDFSGALGALVISSQKQ